MTKEKFRIFWEAWAGSWVQNATVLLNEDAIPVSCLCSFNPSACEDVFKAYDNQKKLVKREYFQRGAKGKNDSIDPHLSRYKRAAILTYAVVIADPIKISIKNKKAQKKKAELEKKYKNLKEFDIFYLKQRLAFYVALGSIIQDFPKEKVEAILGGGKTLFRFEELGRDELWDGEDDFCTSLYKDLFFSEYYKNYNVLTMANVYGLLTERCSNLPKLSDKPNHAVFPR